MSKQASIYGSATRAELKVTEPNLRFPAVFCEDLRPKAPAVLKILRRINSLSPDITSLSVEISGDFAPGKQGVSETLH